MCVCLRVYACRVFLCSCVIVRDCEFVDFCGLGFRSSGFRASVLQGFEVFIFSGFQASGYHGFKVLGVQGST